jgi:transcriptional regulator with XRE-family HTH domain
MDSNQFSDLKEFLSDCIKSIKKSYPNLSSVQLAKKLDLTTSTFSRFENREIKKPTFNHALKIVREVCGETRLQDFIKTHYPEMYDNLAKTYPGNSNLEFMPEEAEVYLQDSTTFELLMMATSNAGLSKDIVIAEFGNRGLLALENLITKKILIEQNQIFTLGMKNVNFGQDTVKKLLQNLVNSSYDLDAFGTQVNWLSVQYESVNASTVTPKLRDVYVKANKEIREIFNAPENAGSDVMWAGLVMDSLLKKEKQESNGVIQ